jgi:DNA-binding XRE family transcriptional regulator
VSTRSDRPADGLTVILGERVRRRRLELDMTLAETARRAEVSPSYLSAVESGASTASLGVLSRIAHALDSTLGQLISATTAGSIQRADLKDVDGFRAMSPDGLQMAVVAQCVGPHQSGTSPVPSSNSQLVVYVQTGCLQLALDGQSWDLHEGDTLDAGGSDAVNWRTQSQGASALWASAPLIEDQHTGRRTSARDRS